MPTQTLRIDQNSIRSLTNNDISITTSGNTSQLFLKKDGNVGIGTTDPDAKLTVVGQGKFVRNSVNPCLSIQQSGSGPTALFMGGNVGIGTTNPGAALDVAGRVPFLKNSMQQQCPRLNLYGCCDEFSTGL